MANKNKNLISAYFPSQEKAEQAADDLQKWDKNQEETKLAAWASSPPMKKAH
jgi:hypothetical protein